MRTLVRAVPAVLACSALAAGAAPSSSSALEPAYHLEYAPARHVTATAVVSVRMTDPNYKVGKYRFSVPKPPTIPGFQEASLTKVSVTGLGEQKVAEDKEKAQQRPYLDLSLQVDDKNRSQIERGIEFTYTYDVRTFSQRLVPGPQPAGKPLVTVPADEQAKWLLPTESCPFQDPEFVRFADARGWRIREGEDQLQFLYRFEKSLLDEGWTYNFPGASGGPNVSQKLMDVVRRKQGDCGGYANLTSAVCRLNGIPYDMLPGRLLKSGMIYQVCHANGAAVLKDYGLFALDTSLIVHQRTLQYFGTNSGGLLAFHRGQDMHMFSATNREFVLQVLQSPCVSWQGGGGSANASRQDSWSVKEAP